MNARKAEFLIFIAAAIWGLSFVFTTWGLQSSPPALFLLMRIAGAMVITLCVFGRYIPDLDRATLRQGAVLGLLFCGGYLFQTYSVNFTTVARASFIAAMTLPATPFVTWLVLRRRVARWSVIGVAIALAGLLMLLNPFAGLTEAGDFPRALGLNVGDWIGIASVPIWAFYLNYMDVFTRGREGPGSTGKMLMLQFGTAIPVLALVWLVFESGFVMVPPPGLDTKLVFNAKLIGALAYTAIFASFLLTFLQTYAQRYTTPVKAMLIFQFEPIVGTAAAIALLDEKLTPLMALGAAVIIVGVLASELGEMAWASLTGRGGGARPSPADGPESAATGLDPATTTQRMDDTDADRTVVLPEGRARRSRPVERHYADADGTVYMPPGESTIADGAIVVPPEDETIVMDNETKSPQ